MRLIGPPLRIAAIDVGTNTTRLLAAERQASGELTELDRRLIFTRLGEGVDASRRLGPGAIERTVAAIDAFLERCKELGVERIRVAGTSAVRDAANREDLLAAVKATTGLSLEVLPGETEAVLSFAGATADLPPGRYLVLDIGGGSTELASATLQDSGPAAIDGRISLPLGVVRLTERHLTDDTPCPEELAALEADVDQALQAAAAAIPDACEAHLVGVAGTVTSLAAISLGLVDYDPKAVHGVTLASEEVDRLYHHLAAMTLPEREQLGPLPPGRADVIIAGCGILSRVLASWNFTGLRVSEKDILDGLTQAMVQEMTGGHRVGES
ncbi:MAG: Ppx/GppA phosphatase family protein [Actinomycetota bacterium]